MSVTPPVLGEGSPPSTPAIMLTPKEIEGKIAAINATQIEAVAKMIIAKVMEGLDIDVCRHEPVEGETYPDTSGNLHQVYWDQYDPSSNFLKALLPNVVKMITDSFSTPSDFLANGIEFTFIDHCTRTGLVNEITDEILKPRISGGIGRITSSLSLNTLGYGMTLKLDTTHTRERSELYFSVDSFINGARIGNDGGFLRSIEKFASQSRV